MNENSSFDEFMAGLDAGSERAVSRLFHLYGQRLVALARSRLDERIRQKLDSEDVVQSVFKSFLIRKAGGAYDLREWNDLWSLLVRITINKCINRDQQFRTLRRNVGVEDVAQAGDDMSAAAWEFISRQPGPEEAAILTETLQEIMRGLDGVDRQIIQKKLQDYTQREIAEALNTSQATVNRVEVDPIGWTANRVD